jgi:hypothetical protein
VYRTYSLQVLVPSKLKLITRTKSDLGGNIGVIRTEVVFQYLLYNKLNMNYTNQSYHMIYQLKYFIFIYTTDIKYITFRMILSQNIKLQTKHKIIFPTFKNIFTQPVIRLKLYIWC